MFVAVGMTTAKSVKWETVAFPLVVASYVTPVVDQAFAALSQNWTTPVVVVDAPNVNVNTLPAVANESTFYKVVAPDTVS